MSEEKTDSKWIPSFLQNRFNDPFFGSFVFSWIIINWNPIYVTFFVDQKYFEEDYENKHHYIRTLYDWKGEWLSVPNYFWCGLLFLVVIPFITTLIYIYFLKPAFLFFEKKITLNKLRAKTNSERINKLNYISKLEKKNLHYSTFINYVVNNYVRDTESSISKLQQVSSYLNSIQSDHRGEEAKIAESSKMLNSILRNKSSFMKRYSKLVSNLKTDNIDLYTETKDYYDE